MWLLIAKEKIVFVRLGCGGEKVKNFWPLSYTVMESKGLAIKRAKIIANLISYLARRATNVNVYITLYGFLLFWQELQACRSSHKGSFTHPSSCRKESQLLQPLGL